MDKELETTTMKIRLTTRKTLRLIAAMADESILEVLDRLARQELERIKERTGFNPGS